MHSMEEPITDLVEKGNESRLRAYLAKITADERLLAVLVCRPNGSTIFKSERAPPAISCDSDAAGASPARSQIVQLPSGSVQISRFDFDAAEPTPFRVLMLHDLSFVDRRQRTARDFVLVFVGISVLLLALLVVLVAWLQLRRWVQVLIGDIRGKRFLDDAQSPRSSMPILSQVRKVLAEAEEQQRLEIDFRENWTPQALRQVVRDQLHSAQVIIVSNREPYIHNFDADHRPVWQVPASGMVTALEPIMRACSGVWVAHGAGTADRATVDRYDQIRVPPDDPSYTLRRVWLTEEQEQGYYYGFSNEGLWPLCHLAYVRPAFRASDWRAYEEVNAKFAEVVAPESNTDSSGDSDPGFSFRAAAAADPQENTQGDDRAVLAHPLAQCRDLRRVSVEARDADCTCCRRTSWDFTPAITARISSTPWIAFVECQIDREHMTVTLQGPCVPGRALSDLHRVAAALAAAAAGCRRLPGGGARALSDRPRCGHRAWAWSAGISPRASSSASMRSRRCSTRIRGTAARSACCRSRRLRAASYRPTRRCSSIPTQKWSASTANSREGDWRPIVLIDEHQEPLRVFELYRAADFCLVNSLHDGMNLVAKEFVAARDDEDGVLILSTFAGASRELAEAVLINPFDVTETAEAMEIAMRMGRDERRNRMSLMRRTVKENNVYRWAGRMLMDAARIRQRQSLPSMARRFGTFRR